jgi:putative thioredoxin
MSQTSFIFDATSENFQRDVIEASMRQPVLVDFWADWCAPCKMLMPVLAKLAEEFQGGFRLAKVNTDREQALAAQFGVRSLPTVKVFSEGSVVDEFMGALPETEVRRFIEKYVESDADRIVAQAKSLHREGQTPDAIKSLREFLDHHTDDDAVRVALTDLCIDSGQLDDARAALDSVSPGGKLTPDYKSMQARLTVAEAADNAPDRAELESRVEADPLDVPARLQLSAILYGAGDVEAAMSQLLDLVKLGRGDATEKGRQALIDLFEVIGPRDDRVVKYRRLLAQALN